MTARRSTDDELPDLREVVGRALISGHLEWDPATNLVRDVHRVAALARAPVTGSAAWRLKFAHDPAAWKVAVAQLARLAATRLRLPVAKRGRPNRILFAAAAQAVREYLYTSCLSCGGRGTVLKNGNLVVSCDRCGGDGARGWKVAQRAAALGLDPEVYEKVWAGRLGKICALLYETDDRTETAVRTQLGLRKRRAA